MRRTLRMVLAAGLVSGVPAVLAAQSAANASASVQVTDGGDIIVVKLLDMDFGARTSGSIVHSSDVGASAAWDVSLASAANYSFFFTLPSTLQGPGGATVPISFGASAASSPQVVPTAWDPNTPIGISAPAGSALTIELGKDALNDGSGDATVNLSGATAGSYTGLITLTVAVLDP